MRASEFLKENSSTSTTTAGNIAPVVQGGAALGTMITRTIMPKPTKYANSAYKAKPRKQ